MVVLDEIGRFPDIDLPDLEIQVFDGALPMTHFVSVMEKYYLLTSLVIIKSADHRLKLFCQSELWLQSYLTLKIWQCCSF
jgi:hypothetical protein